MAQITALFWDVGGVVLTNGWDRREREHAAQKFGLDRGEFEDRHELVAGRFETGKLTLDHYLDRTVFYRPRNFEKETFKTYMFGLSKPIDGTLGVVDRIARSGRYLLATLNNESRELNLHRIEHFKLRKYFTLFMSSCFLGVKKPDDEIFRLALDLTQRDPEECLFIDDRELNLECAARLRLRTLQFKGVAQIEKDLHNAGVSF
ncbi:MAG: HAD family phosphatase [Acidobacteria bacterium]|nr:MAG: HAD family phosphatase [Acidobacteriota bacterium]